MKPAKVLKIFKKGAKASSKKHGKASAGDFKWPSGIRIGVYGHSNSGKTVYFTTLNEDCKVSRRLQISAADSKTASEFLANYRQIWGLGTSSTAGTVVDLRGEQKFPEPTEGDRVLQFNAVLDRSRKLSVVTYDYNGKAVSISDTGELKDKVFDFVENADGIVFFYDSKILSAELESQAQAASFVTMLERLAPLSSRLPIPVALVVSKSDILPGFKGENQAVLVGPEDEQFFSEDFELFLEKVLGSNRIASNSEWAGSVRSVLVKLKDFLKVVVGRTLDFQIFFISNTGQPPEKIGTEVGRSVYKPPRIIRPVGIQEPFYWILKSVTRSRRISKLRTFTKYVALLSVLWIAIYSLPYAYHFKYLLPQTVRVERDILDNYSGDMLSLDREARARIRSTYDRYSRAWVVKWFFPGFAPPSRRIAHVYDHFDVRDAFGRLDNAIERFSAVVAEPKLWPAIDPKDSSLIPTEEHNKLDSDLREFLGTDSSSLLFRRSTRAVDYWEQFRKAIVDPNDTTFWALINRMVEKDRNLYAGDLSGAEERLMEALRAVKVKKVETVTTKKAGVELDALVKEINGNNSPEYRLGQAVDRLKEIRGQLGTGPGATMVDRYLAEAKRWKDRRQAFRYKVEKVPDDGVLYIEVTEHGSDPKWSAFQPIYQDEEYEIEWKVGDDIHIGFCEVNRECNRGRDPSDKILLNEECSLFEMEKDLHFKSINKHVKLRFKPGLMEKLPVLK